MQEVSKTRGRPKAAPLPLPEGMVQINAQELRLLRMDSIRWKALKDAGVEHWEGWGYAEGIMNHEYNLHLV